MLPNPLPNTRALHPTAVFPKGGQKCCAPAKYSNANGADPLPARHAISHSSTEPIIEWPILFPLQGTQEVIITHLASQIKSTAAILPGICFPPKHALSHPWTLSQATAAGRAPYLKTIFTPHPVTIDYSATPIIVHPPGAQAFSTLPGPHNRTHALVHLPDAPALKISPGSQWRTFPGETALKPSPGPRIGPALAQPGAAACPQPS